MNKYYGKVIYVESSLAGEGVNFIDFKYPEIVRALLSYRHYGVGIGNSEVIHFNDESLASEKIIKSTLDEFSQGAEIKECFRVSHKYPAEEIIERANAELDTDFGGYNFLKNNCEHFTSWCASGKRTSSQVGFLDDDQDVVEKAIDCFFESLFQMVRDIDRKNQRHNYLCQNFFIHIE